MFRREGEKKKKIIKEREDERGFPLLKQQLLEMGAGAGGREGLLITVCEPPMEKKKKKSRCQGSKWDIKGRECWLGLRRV